MYIEKELKKEKERKNKEEKWNIEMRRFVVNRFPLVYFYENVISIKRCTLEEGVSYSVDDKTSLDRKSQNCVGASP